MTVAAIVTPDSIESLEVATGTQLAASVPTIEARDVVKSPLNAPAQDLAAPILPPVESEKPPK